MKTLRAAVAVIVVLIGTPAFAADMAVKAPPPAPAPVYNWTGWYVGGNVGASFGRVKADINGAPVTVNIGGPPIPVPGFAVSDTLEPSGFIGGGQIGYNWQYSPTWVLGLEADLQGSGEKDGITHNNPFAFTVLGDVDVIGAAVTNYEAKIDWFGTVRGRIGYVFGNGMVMSYVTGGLAYGKVELDATTTVSGTAAAIPFATSHAIRHSQVNIGWVVGFGTEGKLLIPGWTYKIESLYIDLGSDPETDNPILVSNASGGLITGHAHFTDAILRAGLNYQFH
jgi:outer membrane immunogenic protein